MKETNVFDGLEDLSTCLRRLKSLLAWLELKENERRPGDAPVLVVDVDLASDLRNEQSRFASIATELLDALNHSTGRGIPENHCVPWRGQVLRLIAEMQRLPIPKGL